MGQLGFFDLIDRYEQLSEQGDPLEKLNTIIPWEKFRFTLNRALEKTRKNAAGRKPFDVVFMFKILILQSLYNLSDAQTEYQIRDRLTFMRFLGLGLEDTCPDEKTIWLFRERLINTNTINKLFNRFEEYLQEQGFSARLGSIIDASIVEIPRQRNTREENKQIKAGETPEEWKNKPNQLRQKDVDARWTRKNNQNYYGYKNHINVDVQHKIIRTFVTTSASQGDITCFQSLLTTSPITDKKVWADCAYRSKATESWLQDNGYESRINFKPKKGNWISSVEKRWNTRYSKIRARVEHVFGFRANTMKSTIVRTVGATRAHFKIGMNNLTYNLCRYQQLNRPARA